MIQRGDCPRFTLEPLAELFFGKFDRDIAAQARIERAIHVAHPALAEFRGNSVMSDGGTDLLFFSAHFFSPTFQLTATAMGTMAPVPALRFTRKRLPSQFRS
jgi:hypothetical protein